MTACYENIRGMQWLKISVYPFCLLTEKSKHLQEFRGGDVSVQGHKSWRRCAERKGQTVLVALRSVMAPMARPKAEMRI